VANSFEHIWSEQGIESWVLAPFGALYALGWWSYQSIYKLGLKKPFEPHSPIVTVGNLIAGGAGKTPMALHVADVLKGMGRQVVLSTSGYGFPRAQSATHAPTGELMASEWGDEPAMVRLLRPDLPLVVGRDRVEAARIVHENHPGATLLMDDGFQHLRLRQHATIVLDGDPSNRFCLPAGPYREPRSTGRSRANLVLPSNEFHLRKSPTIIQQVMGPQRVLNELNVLCALARPYRLTEALHNEGFELKTVRNLPDHDPMTAGTLLKDFDMGTPLLVTAKDWVKLRERTDLEGRTIFMASYEVKVEPESEFRDWLRERLDGIGK